MEYGSNLYYLVFREWNVTYASKASLMLEFLIQVIVKVCSREAEFCSPFYPNDMHDYLHGSGNVFCTFMATVIFRPCITWNICKLYWSKHHLITNTNKPFLFCYLQELVAVRDPPSFYLDKLKAHMTMKGSKVNKSWLKMSKAVVQPRGWDYGMKCEWMVGPT